MDYGLYFRVSGNAMKVFNVIIFIVVFGCTSQPKSNITYLDLSNRKLMAIPDSVFSLSQLEYLQLGNNVTLYPPLSALYTEKGSGDSLNKISEIPKDIEKLRRLRLLSLFYNDLRALPKEISKLEKLDTLDISFNEHLRIVAELETLKKMHWLKYLNVVATNVDQRSIEELRKSLPNTKIDAKVEDLMIETSD
jgi:Leucine-rich repeat (LRR) protein